ncbi:MAG: hypothetical protein ACI841_003073 [Planctomycetota bacterium]|jgi:hypothetical protein
MLMGVADDVRRDICEAFSACRDDSEALRIRQLQTHAAIAEAVGVPRNAHKDYGRLIASYAVDPQAQLVTGDAAAAACDMQRSPLLCRVAATRMIRVRAARATIAKAPG